MPWITVKAKEALVDERLMELEIEAKSDDYQWTEKAIRTEDIMDFYKLTEKKIVIAFYDERRRLTVAAEYDEFFKRIEDIDYEGMEEEKDEEEDKTNKMY